MSPESADTTSAPSTVTSLLTGSDVTLPAAWSGQAKVTVTVLGKCATRTPSVYTELPADLALDLPQNQEITTTASVVAVPPDHQPILTLGVNPVPDAVPRLTVYSAAVDDDGAFHRFWDLTLSPGDHRTHVHGTLVNEDGQGTNILVDAETSLQPCEDEGTVGLPRALASGSTIDGWVSTARARLTLTATTTDGLRRVVVVLTAIRAQ